MISIRKISLIITILILLSATLFITACAVTENDGLNGTIKQQTNELYDKHDDVDKTSIQPVDEHSDKHDDLNKKDEQSTDEHNNNYGDIAYDHIVYISNEILRCFNYL